MERELAELFEAIEKRLKALEQALLPQVVNFDEPPAPPVELGEGPADLG